VAAEAREHMEDLVAEARAEHATGGHLSRRPAGRAEAGSASPHRGKRQQRPNRAPSVAVAH
jgi:hypothetical protein